METMQTMINRRSIRKYKDEPIPKEKLDKILRAGLLAPTSQNKKPCEFYIIKDRDTLEKLSKAKKFAAGMLAGCDCAIAVFADSKKADVWIEDCSIALAYMNLMATDLGIGSCWCQMRLRSSVLGKDAEENVKKIMHITNPQMRIVGILALGMADKESQPHTDQDLDWEKTHIL